MKVKAKVCKVNNISFLNFTTVILEVVFTRYLSRFLHFFQVIFLRFSTEFSKIQAIFFQNPVTHMLKIRRKSTIIFCEDRLLDAMILYPSEKWNVLEAQQASRCAREAISQNR